MDTSNHSSRESWSWRPCKLVLLPIFAHQTVTLRCGCLNLQYSSEHFSTLQSTVSCPVSVTFLWVIELTDLRIGLAIETDLIGIHQQYALGIHISN